MGIFQSSKKEEESDKKLNTESNNIERPTNIKEEDKPKIIVHIEKGNIQPKSIKIEPENGIDLESSQIAYFGIAKENTIYISIYMN